MQPDFQPGSGCDTGTGSGTQIQNEMSVASHELGETVTDPEVGLATVYAPPLAWYDGSNGEIGDICNAQESSVVGGDGLTYSVQQLFSNFESNCITTAAAVANDFSVAANPAGVTIAQGGAAGVASIDTTVLSGSSTPVALAVAGLPPGASATLTPTSVAAGSSSTLSISAGTAAAGSYTVSVTGNSGAATRSTSIVLTIDPWPTACAGACISIGDKTMLEGNVGKRAFSFPVTLSQPATVPVSVSWTASSITANGFDFVARSGTLTFTPTAAGTTPISKPISVSVISDTANEPDETFAVTLSNPVGGGYALGHRVGIGTILNDDGGAAGATMGIGSGTIAKAAAGKQNVLVPVGLSDKLGSSVSVTYTVTPGTATYSAKVTGGGDFGGKPTGTLTFAAGAVFKTISIPIWADPNPDTDESFTVTLSNPIGPGFAVSRGTGTVTILGS